MMPESEIFGVVFIKKKRATFVALILKTKPHHTKDFASSQLFSLQIVGGGGNFGYYNKGML